MGTDSPVSVRTRSPSFRESMRWGPVGVATGAWPRKQAMEGGAAVVVVVVGAAVVVVVVGAAVVVVVVGAAVVVVVVVIGFHCAYKLVLSVIVKVLVDE